MVIAAITLTSTLLVLDYLGDVMALGPTSLF
jgi:hypothetical protein